MHSNCIDYKFFPSSSISMYTHSNCMDYRVIFLFHIHIRVVYDLKLYGFQTKKKKR